MAFTTSGLFCSTVRALAPSTRLPAPAALTYSAYRVIVYTSGAAVGGLCLPPRMRFSIGLPAVAWERAPVGFFLFL